ncbi:MAG TPA: HlyD family secretion protein, partial [Halomonas sp.]|nr:HlyD family secretion protein [Halomonas sp.]
ITLDDVPDDTLLSVGMTATVHVLPESSSQATSP